MPIASAPDSRHRTKQEFAYQTLKDAILRCDLRPNERLIIDDLARRLHVSAIPIREAIQMLQSEGLVVTVPHTGATVAPISPASIQDVFAVLEGLELVASRLVAESGNLDELNNLARLVDEMDRLAERQDHAEWAELNTRFHRTIGSLPGMPLMAEMTERALERWNRVRRYYFRGVLVHRVGLAQQEHHEMIAAMRAADLPRLEAAVRQHNRRAFAAYMTYLASAKDAPDAPATAGLS